MPYTSPRFKPTTTRTFFLQQAFSSTTLQGIHDVQFEATDIIDTEKKSAPAGLALRVGFPRRDSEARLSAVKPQSYAERGW